MSKTMAKDRWIRVAAWFLAVSYALGAPVAAVAEFRSDALSSRFDLPSVLIYLTCAVQLVCAIGVLVRPLAAWAALALTLTTLGAIGSHVRIGSPETAIAAIVYTTIQIWFGLMSRSRKTRTA